jgi:hypothetical protein
VDLMPKRSIDILQDLTAARRFAGPHRPADLSATDPFRAHLIERRPARTPFSDGRQPASPEDRFR